MEQRHLESPVFHPIDFQHSSFAFFWAVKILQKNIWQFSSLDSELHKKN